MKTSLFIFLCILRDLPQQQKIPRELVMWWGGEILLYFYVPMFPWKDFLMRQIRKIQKHKGGNGTDQEFFKKNKKEKEWRKEKEEIFHVCTWRFPYSCVLSIG
jgi:hypothetical protein